LYVSREKMLSGTSKFMSWLPQQLYHGVTHRADDPVVPVVDREIVEHHVAERDAERCLQQSRLRDHIVPNEIELGLRFRLRVREQKHVEARRLAGSPQGEINAVPQRTGRFQPRIAQAERLRRALRRVLVIKQRQVGSGLERRHPSSGFDDKNRVTLGNRQAPMPVRVGECHILAVGDRARTTGPPPRLQPASRGV
jgi:hypothetical protein